MADPVALIGVPWTDRNALYAATTVLPVFGVYLVVLRARRRFVLEVSFDWDDWLLVPAFLLILGCALTLIVGVVNMGLGYPAPPINDTIYCVQPVLQLAVKIELAFLLQMSLAFGLLKMSVTFFYRRIFATRTGSVFDWVSWFVILVAGIWTLVFFILFIVLANRQSTALVQLTADNTCSPQYYFLADYFVLSDLMTNILVWLLPFPMVWRLRIRSSQKLMILGALALGTISVIGGAVKTMISLKVAALDPNADIDWELTITTALFWCMIEGGLAVVASCLPDLYYYAMKLADPEEETEASLNKPLPQTPPGPTMQIRKFSVGNAPDGPMVYPRPILRNPQSGAFRSNSQRDAAQRGAARERLKYEMDQRRSQDVWGADRVYAPQPAPKMTFAQEAAPHGTHVPEAPEVAPRRSRKRKSRAAPTQEAQQAPVREAQPDTAFLDVRQDSVVDAACPIHGSHPVPTNTMPVSRFTPTEPQIWGEDTITPAPRLAPQYPNGRPPKQKMIPR